MKSGKISENELDVDSLENLRGTKKRNKLIDFDENIKLLKPELMTKFSDKTIDKTDCEIKVIDSKSSELKSFELDLTESKENSQINKKNFKPVFVSTPAKYSGETKEMSKTDISIDTEEENTKNSSSSLKSKENNFPKTSKFGVSSFPQEKVEELLYKSFIKQKSKLPFSLKDKSESGCKKSTKKGKLNKFKKQFNKIDKHIQKNLNKYCISTEGGEKRRRIDINSSDSDVEVIDLDTSLFSGMKSKSESVCIDFDIKDYDWNEPFVILNNEVPSVTEAANSCENKEIEEVTISDADLEKTGISFYSNENDKKKGKKVWECPICFELSKGQEVVATQCGHIFCRKCLENHFSKLSKNCPSCRINLNNKPVITLFNF